MTWKITVTVPDSRFSSACAAIVKFGKIEITRVDVESEPADNGNGKVSPILSIGPNVPRKSTIPDKLCMLLEKLEKKHGPHTVTRAQLNQAIRDGGNPESWISTGVTTAIAAGFLRSEK